MDKALLYEEIAAYIRSYQVTARARSTAVLGDGEFCCVCLRKAPTIDRSHESIEEYLKKRDEPFSRVLFSYIDKAGISDVECYKRANVDKKTFSKIKCSDEYKPSKKTAVSFALALHLDIVETSHLLKSAGLALSKNSTFDLIIEYFIKTGRYETIDDVNEALYEFDQPTLGV